MKLSLEWLKEYVELPEDVTPEQIMYDLTMCTVEVEELHDLASDLAEIYVGIVEELKPHPDADRLQIAVTNLGPTFGVKEIVCGGSNLKTGMAVPVAVPGAWVNWHGDSEKTQLKETKVRGVVSFGMICAASEIGLADLFPATSDKEIVDFGDPSAVPGMPVSEYLGYADIILDIDNKSLTNRPDLWGHYGVARELSAIYKCPLKPLPQFDLSGLERTANVSVAINDTHRCQRFLATVVEGVTNGVSPLWMRSRLARVGQRPRSVLVDLTNYVMFAIGKPTHAFDTTRIAGGSLVVRGSVEGEELELLDGTKLALDTDTLIVADAERPLGLAGVMGGLGSGVHAETSSIVLESANFSASYIRKVAKRYEVRTESSMRFEKGLDTQATLASQHLLLSILTELQPGVTCFLADDVFPVTPSPTVIQVSQEFIDSRIGMEVPVKEITRILESLGFSVTEESGLFSITVPQWRATGDVSLPEDIVEEVARLLGFDSLEFEPIPVLLSSAIRQTGYELEQNIRSYLAQKGGLQEIVTYPWVQDAFIEACGATEDRAIELSAPPAPDMRKLKTSLVPSLLEVVEKNIRFFNEFGLFEISRVFLSEANPSEHNPEEMLPSQPKHLGMVYVDSDPQTAFLKLKGILESVLATLMLPVEICYQPECIPQWCEKSASVSLRAGDLELGTLGLASRRTLNKCGITRHSVAIATCNVDLLQRLSLEEKKYKPIPKYPEIEFDLSVVFDKQVPWNQIESNVRTTDALIREVVFIDEYTGKQIPEQKKSIAFKMFLGDDSCTLTSEQAETVANKVLKNLADALQGELRS